MLMKEQKWQRRERKRRKNRWGMKVDGKSVFTMRDEMRKRDKKKMKENARKRKKNVRASEDH
jgi:hypothetical protein